MTNILDFFRSKNFEIKPTDIARIHISNRKDGMYARYEHANPPYGSSEWFSMQNPSKTNDLFEVVIEHRRKTQNGKEDTYILSIDIKNSGEIPYNPFTFVLKNFCVNQVIHISPKHPQMKFSAKQKQQFLIPEGSQKFSHEYIIDCDNYNSGSNVVVTICRPNENIISWEIPLRYLHNFM